MSFVYIGHGVYTIAEAARITHLQAPRVREWFRGRSQNRIFSPDYERLQSAQPISFLDLIDVHVAGWLREAGVSMQKVRQAYQLLAEEYGPHPFARMGISTNGKSIFFRGYELELSDALNKQIVMERIIARCLKHLSYSQDDIADRWDISKGVAIDPEINFGKPTVSAVRIKTSILATEYEANRYDARLVARWYGIRTEHVMAAVSYERSLAMAA